MSDYQQVLQHPYYRDQENFRHEQRIKQFEKGMQKWGRPFNPDEWSNKQLADHTFGEIIDAEVYTFAMYQRLEQQAKRIAQLEANENYYKSTIAAKDSYIAKLEART